MLKRPGITVCQLLWGKLLLLSSLYCLLAFLPYTYVAVVKAPPYGWVLWFIAHYGLLYWAAWLAGVVVYGRGRKRVPLVLLVMQAALGFFLPHFMRNLQCDGWAYGCGIALLVLLAGIAATDVLSRSTRKDGVSLTMLDYTTALAVACGIAALSAGAALWNSSSSATAPAAARVEFIAWSLISHLLVAAVAVSVFNLFTLAALRTDHPRSARRALIALLIFGGLWFGSARFLENSLTFAGWRAHLYAACWAAALTALAFSTAMPYLTARLREPRRRSGKALWISLAAGLVIVNLALPWLLGGGDWNGLLQSSFVILFWLGLGVSAYQLRPARAKYSLATLLAVLVLSGFAYKSLQATEIFWGKALGSTDDEIARALEGYGASDASFQLAYSLLGNGRSESCGDLCRIMREYTDIRDAQVKADVNLVDPLLGAKGARPNIFVFVIDSLRPDYLGAYNPNVDFSPNLDAFAADSTVVHNVYTQYAGTSLSEPAIWAGMLLLHAHYMQPFARVNSLEKLARADGYKMLVSWDEVLSQILDPSDNLVKLDTDKPLWNELEVCSTIQQAERVLDSPSSQPIFFYAQPKNVHQFAHNHLPGMRLSGWQARPEFVDRIAFEVHQVDTCLGGFFAYLKQRGLYDNSIIVVTSDHGDATGEYGRYSHSLSIYPEVIRVPLIVHLPKKMRGAVVYDDRRISALTDIAPSLYYLLGHRPVTANPMFGHPLFMANMDELHSYHRRELFLASDERAVYGILDDNGRYLYATYDSPPKSYLYDLYSDPAGVHDILTPVLKKEYDERIIEHLQAIGAFYGYKPKFSALIAGGGK